jgi:hypothetical protein
MLTAPLVCFVAAPIGEKGMAPTTVTMMRHNIKTLSTARLS